MAEDYINELDDALRLRPGEGAYRSDGPERCGDPF